MKKVIIILIIVAVGVFVWQFFNKKALAPAVITPDSNSEHNQEHQNISSEDGINMFHVDNNFSEETEYYTINVTLPETENIQAIPDIQKYATERINEFKEFALGLEDLETVSFPWNLEINFETVESDTITTYIAHAYEYTGGAHPNSYTKTFHYSKINNEKIMTQDIIPDADTLYILAALADKELTIDYPEGSSGETYDNWDTWFADNNSVTFIFVPYQIASYAVGEQKFKVVAVGDNKNIFNQKYFVSN
jgi:hypothetical protein